jgi:ABC-type transport system substrate-binding protein
MIRLVSLLFLLSALQACSNHSEHEPTATALEMTGAESTFAFKPKDWTAGETTWWKDSDGVDPGTAGCHIGTDQDGSPNGRMFGEACLANGLLVESNPSAGELHSHDNDIGYPNRFDCAAWCIGEGKSGGSCKPAAAPPCEQSARCECN